MGYDQVDVVVIVRRTLAQEPPVNVCRHCHAQSEVSQRTTSHDLYLPTVWPMHPMSPFGTRAVDRAEIVLETTLAPPEFIRREVLFALRYH